MSVRNMAEREFSILLFDAKGSASLENDIQSRLNEIFDRMGAKAHAFNTGGDSFFGLFDDSEGAIDALKTLTNELQEISQNGKVTGRLVLHHGKVKCGSDESPVDRMRHAEGMALTAAARLEPMVKPNQAWATEEFMKVARQPGLKTGQRMHCMLPKRFGLWEVHYLRNLVRGKHEDAPMQDYYLATISRDGQRMTLDEGGPSSRDIKAQDLSLDEWRERIVELERFLAGDSKLVRTAVAVGIQNYLWDERTGRLLPGLRWKAAKAAEHPLIGRDAFNTGYRLLRDEDDLKELRLPRAQWTTTASWIERRDVKGKEWHGPLDLFLTRNEKIPFPPEQKRVAEGLVGSAVVDLHIGDQQDIATVSLNRSRICPRLEIGICRSIKVPGAFVGTEMRQVEEFGLDRYDQDAGEKNYWIWISNGRVRYLSVSRPFGKEDSDRRATVEGSRLVDTGPDSNFKNYSRIGFCADEWLNEWDSMPGTFSAPAKFFLDHF